MSEARKWKIIEHSWRNTSIENEDGRIVCELDLESFDDLNENNQDKYEQLQRADAELIASAPALRDERDRLANDLKKRIWLLHGSRLNHLLYGDDGRMDCNVCFREYAGATLEQCYEWEISDACTLVTQAALTPAGGGGAG